MAARSRRDTGTDTKAAPARATALVATERWFVRRGLPTFIADYNAREDIFTRASPLLLVIFVLELSYALNAEWTWWQNVLAVAGAVVFVIAVWGAVNRVRGRRLMARPDRIGAVELAVFVFVPPLLELLFNTHVRAFLVETAVNVAILAVVYVIGLFGLIAIFVWALRTVVPELGSVFRLFARALPLLLLFMTFLFINAEVWQVADSLSPRLTAAAMGLFMALALLFLASQIPREVKPLAENEAWTSVVARTRGTPLDGLAPAVPEPRRPVPLSRVEWINLGLVILFLQAVQIALVTGIIAAFFLLFGLLIVPETIVESWTQTGSSVLVDFAPFGVDRPLTAELLRVALFLAGFGGLYFAVTVITDSTYRAEFFEGQMDRIRQALAVRSVYREAV